MLEPAAARREASGYHFEPTRPFGHGISNDLIHEMFQSSEERGSPRPAVRAGGNLVGRGIAYPMSERTRGFELSRKKWNEIPTPRAIFPHNLISNLIGTRHRYQLILGEIIIHEMEFTKVTLSSPGDYLKYNQT
jgi:hypothetical protein